MWGPQAALLLALATALATAQEPGLDTTGQIVMQTKVEQRSIHDTHTFVVSKVGSVEKVTHPTRPWSSSSSLMFLIPWRQSLRRTLSGTFSK